jgi:hypothetical protein
MKRTYLVLGAALTLLWGCAEPSKPSPGAPPTEAAHRHGSAPEIARDECGAREHQDLVGQPRSEIPVPVNPSAQRVACTTCPMTMDFNPRRLNFLYDADTGRIKEVRCG